MEGGGNSLKNNGLDTYTHNISDCSFLDVTEITNTSQDNEYLSSLGLLSNTNIKGEYLPNGTKYTILAYVYKRNFILYKQEEFTVGDVNPKIELDGGKAYVLFIVSIGNSTSVKIENVRHIENLKFIPNDSNTSFLYQKIINFAPSGDRDNVLDVKLKGLVRISVILDVSEFYPDNYHLKVEDIESIDNVKLTYRKYKGVWLQGYANGVIGVDGYEEVILPIKVTSLLNGKMQYKVDFQDTFIVDNESDFKFYAVVKVNGSNEISRISGRLRIKFGYRHTFLLEPTACGSYLGSNIKESNISGSLLP